MSDENLRTVLEHLIGVANQAIKLLDEPKVSPETLVEAVEGVSAESKLPFKVEQLAKDILCTINHKEFLCAEMLAKRLIKYHRYNDIAVKEEELAAHCAVLLEMWREDVETCPEGIVMGECYGGYNPKAPANKGKEIPKYIGKLGVKKAPQHPKISFSGITKVLSSNKNKIFPEGELIKAAYEHVGRTTQSKHPYSKFKELARKELAFYMADASGYKGCIGKTDTGYKYVTKEKSNE